MIPQSIFGKILFLQFLIIVFLPGVLLPQSQADKTSISIENIPMINMFGSESITVSSDGTTVFSSPLSIGIQYRITVQGTYIYWMEMGLAADAEYVNREDGTWTEEPNSNLELLVNDQDIYWGPYSSDHTYTYFMTGTGNPVSFRIEDDFTGDNSGSLTVNIDVCNCSFPQQVSVPSDCTVVASNPLINGIQYQITAQGTYTYFGATGQQADAEYADRGSTPWTDEPNSNIELLVNDQDIYWGSYNSNHTYIYLLTGTGTPAYFRIQDDFPGDNAGNLTLTIAENSNPQPSIFRNPSTMSFNAVQDGADPSSQTLSIRNTGGGTLNWTVSTNRSWLTLSPISGNSDGETDNVTVNVDISGLSQGTHSALITISDPAASNNSQNTSVTLNISAQPIPTIFRNPSIISFNATVNGGNPASQTLQIRNTGGGTLNWIVSSNQQWLTLSPQNGNSTGETDNVSVRVETSGLAEGTHAALITISDASASNTPQNTSVTLNLTMPNSSPQIINTIPDQNLTLGGSAFERNLEASPVIFSDPDGDNLSYTANSSASGVATASISGTLLTVNPVSVGSSTITVTANDNKGGMSSTDFLVSVSDNPNNVPTVINPIPDQNLTEGGRQLTRNLDEAPAIFNDPDGDILNYTATSDFINIATAEINTSNLIVTPLAQGTSKITIRANDGKGGAAVTSFNVFVGANRPPTVIHESLPWQTENQNIAIEATIRDDIGIATATIKFRRGGDQIFRSEPMLEESENLFRGIISAADATSRGIDYFIEAEDLAGLSTREPQAGFHSVEIEVSNLDSNPQPGGNSQTAYRIISIPLDLTDESPEIVLEDDLGTKDITKWRFFEVRRDQTKIEFPNTSPMTAGKGFWLIVREAGKRISTGAGRTNPTDQIFDIVLHPQWNLIGNPFNFPIRVSNLSLSNGQSVELRTYKGSWNDLVNNPDTAIQPFEGYAIFNSSGTNTTLFINPDLSGGSNTLVKQSSFQDDWSLQIIAQSQAAVDGDNFLGLRSIASRSWDELDSPEPPVIGEFVSVYFPRPEWGRLSKDYCTDFRPEISDGEIWEFEVKTNIGDIVTVRLEGLEDVPNEYEVWLIDPPLQASQNLRQNQRFSIAASVAHPKRLQLLIGRPGFADKQLSSIQNIPDRFELSQNFPNPFNPSTTIQFSIEIERRITLTIYNVRGKEVIELIHDELKTQGYHTVIWDGKNRAGRLVSAGLYFYKLQSGKFSSIKKMAFVK